MCPSQFDVWSLQRFGASICALLISLPDSAAYMLAWLPPGSICSTHSASLALPTLFISLHMSVYLSPITAPARPTHSACVLAYHQGRWGLRPSDRSRCSLHVWSISCIGKILMYFVPGRPVHSSPFHPSSGCHMATHFMLAHKAVPHGCRHLSLLPCVHDIN